MPRNRLKCCTMSVLLKTEPSEYSFAELERDGETVWDGVTNPQALRFLRELKPGAKVIIYHTGEERSAVGTARVLSVDAADPKSPVVRIKAGKRLAQAGAAGRDQSEQAFCPITVAEAGQTLGGPSQRRAIQVPALRRKMTRACFKNRSAGLGVFPQGLKPAFLLALDGVAEATPLQSIIFETSSCLCLELHGRSGSDPKSA